MDSPHSADVVWTLLSAVFVYFMHGGFGFFEAGMCREKNTVSTLTHNVTVLGVTVVVYWLFGFGLMYGNGDAVIGRQGFAPDLLDAGAFASLSHRPVPLVVAFAFALAFADTPATLIAGSGAERLRFSAVVVLTVIVSGLVFPVTARWALEGGWLTKLAVPVFDTGAGLVQLVGGACALAVALVLGPRQDRFAGGETRPFGVSSMPMVFLGAFGLWLGFFAFNTGFAMKITPNIGLIVANTALGGSTGAVAAVGVARMVTGRVALRTMIVGLLTANVAICSAAGVVAPWAAVAIGIAAGVMTVGGMQLLARLRVDDATEYVTMNVFGGLLGMLAVGLFASPEIMDVLHVEPAPRAGLFYGGGAGQLASQAIGAAALAIPSFAVVAVACLGLRALGMLRSPPDEEREGADEADTGERAEDAGRDPAT